MKKVLIAYVPVLHQGYVRFFEKHRDADVLFIFSHELVKELDPLHKDIRALSATLVRQTLTDWGIFDQVKILSHEHLEALTRREENHVEPTIVLPDDDACRELVARYLPGHAVQFDSVFLRWDRSHTLAQQEIHYDRKVSFEGLVRDMMSRAFQESHHASDWWRQVGAVIAQDGNILLAGCNQHVPSMHLPYVEGNPRDNFKRGVHIELTTDQHAEARLISEAARSGIALEGTSLYVTTFPCPPCAKSVAYAGIRRCYFCEGYSQLDGERVLRSKNVEIILVEGVPVHESKK